MWRLCAVCETAWVHVCAAAVSTDRTVAIHTVGLGGGSANRRYAIANFDVSQSTEGHGRETPRGMEAQVERHRLSKLKRDDYTAEAFEATHTEAVIQNDEPTEPTSEKFRHGLRRWDVANIPTLLTQF